MILSSDIELFHPLWERADRELVHTYGIFSRLIDVYVIACAIGIMADKTATNTDQPADQPKTIGRNTYTSLQNSDLHDSLDFMLKNAIINTKTINLDNDERLKLAFDPDYSVNKITAVNLLTGFANYGIEEIFKHIDSSATIVAIEDLYKFFDDLVDTRYDDILKTITLGDIM